LCCIRLFPSESSSQSSTTNHGVNQAESHVYSSLLHGNSSLYETIQTRGATGNERSHHPEEGSDYVNMKPGRWSPASTNAAVILRSGTALGNTAELN
ncbi:hypothetical protein XENOCAPTIV_013519, partial [Xenoophorus captivus]